MRLLPLDNCVPWTVRLAVALPPDPDSTAAPSDVWPTAKETDPAGEVVPEAALTVAVRSVLPLDAILVGFARNTVVVEVARLAAQCSAKLSISAEPNPVVSVVSGAGAITQLAADAIRAATGAGNDVVSDRDVVKNSRCGLRHAIQRGIDVAQVQAAIERRFGPGTD